MGEVEINDLTKEHFERYIDARRKEGAHSHSEHKELVVARSALKNAEERGAYRGEVGKVVPRFKSGYLPREV